MACCYGLSKSSSKENFTDTEVSGYRFQPQRQRHMLEDDMTTHPQMTWQLTRSHVGAPWWSSCRKFWLIVILVIDDDDDSDYIVGINVSPSPALGCGAVSCLNLQNVPLLGLTVQGNLHPDLTTRHVYWEGRFIVWIKVPICRHREVKFTTLDDDSCIGSKLFRPISIGCRYLAESWWVAILYVENFNLLCEQMCKFHFRKPWGTLRMINANTDFLCIVALQHGL